MHEDRYQWFLAAFILLLIETFWGYTTEDSAMASRIQINHYFPSYFHNYPCRRDVIWMNIY